LEVVVSDNASRDGTDAVVQGFADSTGIPVTYRRNDRDLGLAENIMRVAEHARGQWMWALGSDDELAGAALATAAALLDAHPDVTAMSHRRALFADDMTTRIHQDAPEYHPLVGETWLYQGADAILANVGMTWAYLGSFVVRREPFVDVIAAERSAAAAHPVWPQVLLLGRLARRRPLWLWYPTPLVKTRTGNSHFEFEHGRPRSGADIHAEAVGSLTAVWAELTEPGSEVRRELRYRTYRSMASPESIRAMKRQAAHGLRADARLARAFVPAFAGLRDFWLRAVPPLAVPAALQRAAAEIRRRRRRPSPPLEEEDMHTTISATVPAGLSARGIVRLPVTVLNTSRAELRRGPPHPVSMSYRWIGPDGDLVLQGSRTALAPVLEPGGSASLVLDLLTPWEPGAYELRLSCVQEFVAWFDDIRPSNGARFAVEVAFAPPCVTSTSAAGASPGEHRECRWRDRRCGPTTR
jgi:hypothetical protein